MDRRTRARELAMQALYQLDIQGGDILSGIEDFFRENEPDSLVQRLAKTWTVESWEHVAQCDELIKTAAVKWELSRLTQVDRSILRLAVYQLAFCPDIPHKVAINEAIELAKKYSGEQSPRFVNGVLDAVMRKIQTSCNAEG